MLFRVFIISYLIYWSHCRPPEVETYHDLKHENAPSTRLEADGTEHDESRDFTIPGGDILTNSNKTVYLKSPPVRASEYMLHLYKKFSRHHAAYLDSTIVRSFVNINHGIRSNNEIMTALDTPVRHMLVFNMSTINRRETVNLALLRFYTLVQNYGNKQLEMSGTVFLYEVLEYNNTGSNTIHLIDYKHIYGSDGGWDVFDVTPQVQKLKRNVKRLQVFELQITTVDKEGTAFLDIDTTFYGKNEPIIVVFSNDNKDVSHRHDIDEMLRHEHDTVTIDSLADILYNDSPNLTYRQRRDTSVILERFRRSKSYAKSSSLSTRSDPYGASSISGRRTSSRSKSRIYNGRHRRKKRTRKSMRQRRQRRHKRNICRKQAMFVNFEDINWHKWIIAPTGFQAYECVGRCYFPLDSHLSPTKHAVIQALMHAIHPRRLGRACCVPTRLEPISILFIDNNVVTYKYRYDGMVVAECGCR